MDKFKGIRNDVRLYTDKVHERKQPHMKVYEMSIAAQSRLKSGNANAQLASAPLVPLDVPSPNIKHRLLGNLLELRIEILQLSEPMRFVKALFNLDGCQEEARSLRHGTIRQCPTQLQKAKKLLQECEKHRYHGHAVEILLHEMELIQLQIYPSTKNASNEKLRQEGQTTLKECDRYLETYQSCEKYRARVNRARKALKTTIPFYEAVSEAERKAILRAMQTEFRGTGHWYYCVNGHPVLPSPIMGFLLMFISSALEIAGWPWNEHGVQSAAK
jgi:hypothetical protein